MKKTVSNTLLALAMASPSIYAQETTVENWSKIEYGFYTGAMYLDEKIASAERIDDVGYLIGGSVTGYYSSLRYGAGIALIVMSDNDKFTQSTESVFGGGVSDESSSIDAGTIYLEIGAHHVFGNENKISAGLMVGYSYFDIDRTISNCRNCYSENINIESSVYLKPFIAYRVSERLVLGMEYSRYQKDQSFDDSIAFKLNFF